MTSFNDIEPKRLQRLRKQMDDFTDATVSTLLDRELLWKSWFAWHPVKVKGKWVWFKKVYRKYNWAKSSSFPFGDEYDYGDIFDVLSHGQHH